MKGRKATHFQVTLRRILSHTTGLSTDGDPGVEPGKAVPTLEEALSGAVTGMDALHVAYPPGAAFRYSSIGYALLELVAEEVTGEPIGRGVLQPETVAETLTAVPFTSEADSPHPIGLGYDLLLVDGVQLGMQKTGDNRGYKSIIVMALEQGEGIAILANSDRAQIGFIFEVVCGWSKTVSGNPLQETCQVMSMVHTVQIAVAAALALGGHALAASLDRCGVCAKG